MEKPRLRHTAQLTQEGIKRVKPKGALDELQKRVKDSQQSAEGEIESPFALGIAYFSEHFGRQAEGLRSIRALNDSDARKKRALPLLLRRKEMLNSLQEALRTESFTEQEREQLQWFYDMGSAFVNQISKELRLFNEQYGMSGTKASVLANMTTAEMQQHLAQLLITQTQRASSKLAGEQKDSTVPRLEEATFSLLHTMSVKVLGLQQGAALYNVIENGVYGAAAAYYLYSDASLNSFGKSFKVLFPSPYIDAIEQTDLLLIDEEDMSAPVRAEIAHALEASLGESQHAVDSVSDAAKKHIYKVQVKCRYNGGAKLTSEEEDERDKFFSARCHAKGFDNCDYLVLTADRAHEIVENVRTVHRRAL